MVGVSKIVPHVIELSAAATAWAARAGFYKRLNGPAPLVRVYWPDAEQNARIASLTVQQTVADIQRVAQPGSIVEVFNEVAQRQGSANGEPGLEQHADFLEHIVPLLHDAGYKVAGFGFSTGNPGVAAFGDKDDFQYLYNRRFCDVDYISMHCYWGPKGFDEYNALRYRALHRTVPSHPPFLITECGRDAVDGGQSGWKASGLTPEQYLAELHAYDVELAKDDYVLHACVFTAGPSTDWANFSTDDLDTSGFTYDVISSRDNTAQTSTTQEITVTPIPPVDDQGNTYRCGAYAVRQWFEGYGYNAAGTRTFAKYAGIADGQQGLAFQQVHDMVSELATEVGATLTWMGDGFLRDFATFDQTVRDHWCDVVGVYEADIHPGQAYYHYIDVYGLNGANFQIADSFHKYDGEQGSEPVTTVHTAVGDNWDAALVGVAFRLTAAAPASGPVVAPAAPVVPVNAQIVTLASVIGDMTYPDGVNMDEQAQGQPAGVTRRIFARELVQQIKALLGA